MYTRTYLFVSTFLIALLLAGSQLLNAQVSSERLAHSRGNNDALVLELPSADGKTVNRLWSDFLRETYDVKTRNVKKGKGEMESLNFSVPGISPGGKVDVYSQINKTAKEGSELIVWIATPDGYVAPGLDRGEYIAAERMLMEFALTVSRAQITQAVKDEEGRLKDLEKDLDRLRRDQQNLENDIAEAQRTIEEAKAKIDRNLIDQENKSVEIQRQIDQVEATKRRLNDL